ncbi:FecCD family ABC transporter permease [Gordonia jinhuaensis]|nr:iron chelate uptake ABC transporter family permease subunit [Gordonia jinhuaensis]
MSAPSVKPPIRLRGRISMRSVIVTLILVVLALVVGVIALGLGDYSVAPARVVAALTGGGNRFEHLVVVEWRLPRVLMALLLGAALGAAGAIFQSITRNPLGSPDIIGFNSGAYTGALVVILVAGQVGYVSRAVGALVGGIVCALVVYLLAFRRGVRGFRFIIVGISVSAMLEAVNAWLIQKADLSQAMSVATWGAGSLNGVTWSQAGPAAVVICVLVPFVLVAGRRLELLDLGDDVASALGVRVESTRLALIVLGIALIAVPAAVAGPIAFVSLAAPHLARRLVRGSGAMLLPAAAMGALLLVLADTVGQHAFGDKQLPVGVVTVSIGGAYLLWLLAWEGRRM